MMKEWESKGEVILSKFDPLISAIAIYYSESEIGGTPVAPLYVPVDFAFLSGLMFRYFEKNRCFAD
ncbi:MAG TPA: hypothetical protein VNM69_08570 [Bacillus sp. (in: firmicutes)]|nr:hypothetical protein [Bacillus sp. (in: firmicutes)]